MAKETDPAEVIDNIRVSGMVGAALGACRAPAEGSGHRCAAATA
jgi:hypothetical protein